MKWNELELGKIYMTKNCNRIIKVNDDVMYVLSTDNFIILSTRDKEVTEFEEYPYGFPNKSLLDEELISGCEAVRKQIADGRAEKQVRLKRRSAIRRFVERKYDYQMTEYKELLKRL